MQPPVPAGDQQQQQRQLGIDTKRDQLPAVFDALSLHSSNSSSSSSGQEQQSLALLDPLQCFWQLLTVVVTPQLSTFSVDSLALTALSFVAAGQGDRQLLLGIVNSGLARPQKWVESPVAVSRMLKALMLTETKHEVKEGLLWRVGDHSAAAPRECRGGGAPYCCCCLCSAFFANKLMLCPWVEMKAKWGNELHVGGSDADRQHMRLVTVLWLGWVGTGNEGR
jgi:hypothetical protein